MQVKPTLNSADIKLLKTIFYTKGETDIKLSSLRSGIKQDLEDNEDKAIQREQKFRSDLFDKIDPILKEVVASREERVIINARLEKIEHKLHD